MSSTHQLNHHHTISHVIACFSSVLILTLIAIGAYVHALYAAEPFFRRFFKDNNGTVTIAGVYIRLNNLNESVGVCVWVGKITKRKKNALTQSEDGRNEKITAKHTIAFSNTIIPPLSLCVLTAHYVM